MLKRKGGREFFGSTTVGEKGQVVIPAPARDTMRIRKGEKLLVFGMGDDMLVFTKSDRLEKIAAELSERLEQIRAVIRRTGAK